MPTEMNLYFGSKPSWSRDFDTTQWHEVDVATEEELLEFVNKGRKAGGANLLEALLPSIPLDPRTCLIATALNFGCRVKTFQDTDKGAVVCWPSKAWKWAMVFPYNMGHAERQAVSETLGLDENAVLPEHIGNAARAFDMGLAFQDYRIEKIF